MNWRICRRVVTGTMARCAGPAGRSVDAGGDMKMGCSKRAFAARRGLDREGRRKSRNVVQDPGCILVTGASSGIGAALAVRYAAPGRVLILWGRDRARLEAVASACRAKGGEARIRRVELTDPAGVLAAAREDDAGAPVDLAILAAGLGDIRAAGAETEEPELALEVGLVNFTAATTLATAFAQAMAGRGRGQIVLLGSVAAFHDLPYAPAYAGSKAGLVRFAGALRLGLRKAGIGVTLVSPGFVDTPMSQRLHCAKPFLMPVDEAAARIQRAVESDRPHLILPWPFAVLRLLSGLLPGAANRWILKRTRVTQTPRS